MSPGSTDKRAPHFGHGEISTAAPSTTGGVGNGGGTSAAGGASGASGIVNCELHLGHLPVLPALSSLTLNVASQPGQENRIMGASKG